MQRELKPESERQKQMERAEKVATVVRVSESEPGVVVGRMVQAEKE